MSGIFKNLVSDDWNIVDATALIIKQVNFYNHWRKIVCILN